LVANVVRDFEPQLSSIVLRPFDDGRFIMRVNGSTIFDKNRTGRFPQYDEQIKPRLSNLA